VIEQDGNIIIEPESTQSLAVDPRTGVPAYRGGKGDNVEPEDPKK
jgi:hypothetical protein